MLLVAGSLFLVSGSPEDWRIVERRHQENVGVFSVLGHASVQVVSGPHFHELRVSGSSLFGVCVA